MPTKEKPDFGTIAGRTAISRRGISVPTRMLLDTGRIPKGVSVLNHGRGKADADAAALTNAASEYAEYDPNYAPNPKALERRYDIVVSNYVINVLPSDLREEAWKDIARTTGGVAYITVRSTGDKSIYKGKKYKDGFIMSTGSFQKPYTAKGFVQEAKKHFKTVEVIAGTQGGIRWTIAASDPKVSDKVDDTKKKTSTPVDKNPIKAPSHMDLDNPDASAIKRIQELAGIS
jgi:hypothetical protein